MEIAIGMLIGGMLLLFGFLLGWFARADLMGKPSKEDEEQRKILTDKFRGANGLFSYKKMVIEDSEDK